MRKLKGKLESIFELSENENTTYQNLLDAAKQEEIYIT